MNRMDKVNSEIRKIIANTIDTKLNNNSLNGLITVTSVDTSKDFSNSVVYISMLGVQNKGEAMETLRRASGFIKSEIAKKTRFRKIPDLRFVYDETIAYGIHMNKVIDEVVKEDELNDSKHDSKNNEENNGNDIEE